MLKKSRKSEKLFRILNKTIFEKYSENKNSKEEV